MNTQSPHLPDPAVVIDGRSLTLESFVEVARFNAQVELSPKALEKLTASRELVETMSQKKQVAYGITTGYGGFANVAVPEDMSAKLSTNLILSHAVGTGEPYSDEQVRGMMLLRANALCVGLSGVRPILVQMLVEMLNKGVTPIVPQKGSLGASGDLAPLSHMSLVILGRGRARYQGAEYEGAEAMGLAGIPTLDTLVSKEGLGLTNGTCAMTSVGALCLYDALNAARLADLGAAMTFTALGGQLGAFDTRIQHARPHKGQIEVARNLRLLTADGEMVRNAQGKRVQDAYSLRCIPQVHGAIRNALNYVAEQVNIELNAVTDNPLLFPDDRAVISGGNFHGEPMALPFDLLGIAVAELASISERRIERMVNANLSNGLPPFLAGNPGVDSGYMIVQYSAASMVSANKVLAHPASVDSIPSSANQEDFVSMGTTAARKAGLILENTLSVLAFELLTACRAIDLRKEMGTWGQNLSPAIQAVHGMIRAQIPFVKEDHDLSLEIEKIEKVVRTEQLLATAKLMVPRFG